MNTIDAYENDIHQQPDYLESFRGQSPIANAEQSGVIFAGSGDSLAASMLAESASYCKVRAMDPLELYRNSRMLAEKKTYFVSVSGETVSNIRAARVAARMSTGMNTRPVAVTANPDSRLARACPESVLLDFPSSGVFTAGSISFLASALTCMSLVKKFRLPHVRRVLATAEKAAGTVKVTGRVFILGDYSTYPIAVYCAAKFHEILGYDAHYSRTEQFSHMELFSTRRKDTVIILERPSRYNGRLADKLGRIGLDVHVPVPPRGDSISDMLFFVFYSQFLPLYRARDAGNRECYFAREDRLRKTSNDMIY